MRRISMLLAAVALLLSGFAPMAPAVTAASAPAATAARAATPVATPAVAVTKAQALARAKACATREVRRVQPAPVRLDAASWKKTADKACNSLPKNRATATPHAAGSPKIGGTVKSAGGLAIPGMVVAALETSDPFDAFVAFVDGTGAFSIAVDANTSYEIVVLDSSEEYFYGYWDSSSSTGLTSDEASANQVDVTTADIDGVDASLPALSGTVTNASAAGLADIDVVVCDQDGYCAYTATDADGDYIVGVAAGSSVYVEFDDSAGTYASGFYNASTGFVPSDADATVLDIATVDVPGIDITLPLAPHISGTVTDVDGQGIWLVEVTACDGDDSDSTCYSAPTDLDGSYSVPVLADGTYELSFRDWKGAHEGGWYSDAGLTQDPSTVTPIQVQSVDITGYDVVLPDYTTWAVKLGVSSATVRNGDSVTISAYANQPIDWSPYFLLIGHPDGTVDMMCEYGTSCSYSDSSPTADTRTYEGILASDPGEFDVVSDPVDVSWIAGSTYFGLTPNRVLDTHAHLGLTSKIGILAGTSFQVAGLAPLDPARNVPANATAVTGVLSVSNSSAGGWVSLTPEPNNNPSTSTINFPKADARSSGVTVPLGAGGKLSVTYGGAAKGNTVDVAFDVTGYFLTGTTGAQYYSLTPNRLLDSRPGAAQTGLTAKLAKGVAKSFQVTGRVPADATKNVPAGAVAVTGTLTVTNQTAAGYLTLGPDALNAPPTASLFFPKGDNRATGLTVKLGAGGTLGVTFTSTTAGATTDVLFDVNGYFLPGPGGAVYVAVTPNRLLDDRTAVKIGLAVPLKVYVAGTFAMTGRYSADATKNIPDGAVAVTGTLTVTNQTASGWLSLNPTPINKPTTSNLNFLKGDNRATGVTVPLSDTGSLSVTFGGAGTGAWTDALFDVSGYFLR